MTPKEQELMEKIMRNSKDLDLAQKLLMELMTLQFEKHFEATKKVVDILNEARK